MAKSALLIGGTGPTGHFIANGLVERGYDTTILHTGRHEVDEISPAIRHIHTDPFDRDCLVGALGGSQYDVTIAAYGRLRRIAEVMVGRTGHFIAIGGVPIYRGYARPELNTPFGLPIPTGETAPKVLIEDDDPKGYRVQLSERMLFDLHPEATYLRYPFVYGKYQYAPKEWSIVRRLIDKRPHIIVTADGLTLNHSGYAGNLAHALLLAVDNPSASKGQSYNCGDDRILTIAQQIQLCADALGQPIETISIPYEFALPARSLVTAPFTTHRVFDITKIKLELGYRDLVAPEEALVHTARLLRDAPPAPRGREEQLLGDPFDYAAEDLVIDRWRAAIAGLEPVNFAEEPGYIGYERSGAITARKGGFD